jgi:hypothetical protein
VRSASLGRGYQPRWRLPPREIDWVHIAIAVLLSLAAPSVGLLLVPYRATRRDRMGLSVMVAAMLGAAALAIAILLAPMLFWNRLLNL